MAEYNGHPSKGHWNVALWLGNDEGLYRSAIEIIAQARKDIETNPLLKRRTVYSLAADRMGLYGTETPDGFRYTKERLMAALRGLDE